jgi:hypothetical protein
MRYCSRQPTRIRWSCENFSPRALHKITVAFAVFCASIPIYAVSYVVRHIGLAHFSPRDVAVYTFE